MQAATPPSLVPAVLEVRDLTIRFGDVRVVDDPVIIAVAAGIFFPGLCVRHRA